MAKILLVEDDNNLREIYQARLTAEGYDIIAAQNGEEALVLAKQHHPDLVISDVMMPRISGYEMLDILRNTEELKHTKVIMLTALGQNEDKERAGKLGADKYLVKSQVTLEDIVNSAKALLADDSVGTPQATVPDATDPLGMSATSQTDDDTVLPSVSPVATPVTPLNMIVEPVAVAQVAEETAPVVPEAPFVPQPVAFEPVAAPSAPSSPEAPQMPTEPVLPPTETSTDTSLATEPAITSTESPVSEPVSIDSLINGAPVATEPLTQGSPSNVGTVQTAENEQAVVDQQIASFNLQPVAQPIAQSGVEQQNDATLSDALQTLTSEKPISANPSTTQPSVVSDSQGEVVQTHGIEGLSGVNEVVEVPEESHIDPTPSPTATVIPPVVEHLAPAPETVQPTPEPTPLTQTVAPTETPPAPIEEPTSGPDNDGVNVVGKKVIQPLSDPNNRPDLDKLLAQEEAIQSAETLPQPPAVGPTAPVTAPAPKPANGFDPNSIAL